MESAEVQAEQCTVDVGGQNCREVNIYLELAWSHCDQHLTADGAGAPGTGMQGAVVWTRPQTHCGLPR